MVEKQKIEAIKKLYDKDKTKIIEVDGEIFHGWSIKGIVVHLHLNLFNDLEILKLYNLENENKNIDIKAIEDSIFIHNIDKYFMKILRVEMYRAERFQLPLSLIYMEFNDDLAKKDLELKMIEYIKKIMRPSDFVTSLNYNKYFVLLTHTNEIQAKQFINRIHHSMEALIDIYKLEVKFSLLNFNKESTPEEFIKKILNQ
jgi:hypothetical protein